MAILKSRDIGTFPDFIHLGQRHLEKEKGTEREVDGVKEFTIPVDLLRITIPPSVLEDVTEVCLGYRKR